MIIYLCLLIVVLIKEKEKGMFGLTLKNTENKATVTIEESSTICSYRGEIALRAMQMGAVGSSHFEILFASEKEMYTFISKLSEFCK